MNAALFAKVQEYFQTIFLVLWYHKEQIWHYLIESLNTYLMFPYAVCSLTMTEALWQLCPHYTKASFIIGAYNGWLKDIAVDTVLSLSFWPSPTVVSPELDGRNGLTSFPAPEMPLF